MTRRFKGSKSGDPEQSLVTMLKALGVSDEEALVEKLQEMIADHPELSKIVKDGAKAQQDAVTSDALIGLIDEALGDNLDALPEDVKRKIKELRAKKGERSSTEKRTESAGDNVIPLKGPATPPSSDPGGTPPTPTPFGR